MKKLSFIRTCPAKKNFNNDLFFMILYPKVNHSYQSFRLFLFISERSSSNLSKLCKLHFTT